MSRPPSLQPRRPRLNVGFLLVDGFTLSAFANFVDVLRLSADEGDGSRQIDCSWKILGRTSAAVVSSCGIAVQPDERSFDPKAFDYLVIVGGVLRDRTKPDAWHLKVLKQAAAGGIPLVALCTGVFHLTEAGLMKGYRCCVSWFHHEDFLNQFDRTTPVSDQLYVVDRDRLTCSGGVGSAHLAARLVSMHVSSATAIKSLNIMMIDRVLDGEVPQPQSGAHFYVEDEMVSKAIHLMRQRMSAPPTASEIASRMNVSQRQLERRFQAATGSGPARICRIIRLTQGSAMLARGGRTLAEVAEETGFCDASHFIRSFRKEFGHPPSQMAIVSAEPDA